jgi:hypothetical protein
VAVFIEKLLVSLLKMEKRGKTFFWGEGYLRSVTSGDTKVISARVAFVSCCLRLPRLGHGPCQLGELAQVLDDRCALQRLLNDIKKDKYLHTYICIILFC